MNVMNDTMEIPKQVWMGTERPREEQMDPIENRDDLVSKPYGGLWTSPIDSEFGWLDWCEMEDFFRSDEDEYLYEFIVDNDDDDVLVYTIDCEYDLNALLDLFERDDIQKRSFQLFAPLDFEALATVYDGIYLTENGQRETRLTEPSLNGWDCECVLWLDWCFSDVEYIKEVNP